MKGASKYCYSISAMCAAILIHNSNNPVFFTDHANCALLLAMSIPSNVVAGWFSENHLGKESSKITLIVISAGVLLGLISLTFFFFGLSPSVGYGFILGLGYIASVYLNMNR